MRKIDIEVLSGRWLQAGVINQQQADYIIRDTEEYVSEISGGKFITSIMYLGALALAGGVLLIIASNWIWFPDFLKSIVAILMPTIPLICAYWMMRVNEKVTVLSRVFNVVGVALIGGSIALIHLQTSIQGTLWLWLWLWFILSVPFIFVFKRAENVFLSTLLLGVSLFISLIEFFDVNNIDEDVGILLLTIVTLVYSYVMYAIGDMLRYSTDWISGGRLLRISAGTLAVTTLFITTFEYYAELIVGDRGPVIGLSIFLNLFFIAFLVFALFRAVKYEEYNFSFWVMRVGAIYLFVKYITLFGTMMDTGLFLIFGGGIFIFGASMLEKNKKTLVNYMRGVQAPEAQVVVNDSDSLYE